jgi:hypothetical protein
MSKCCNLYHSGRKSLYYIYTYKLYYIFYFKSIRKKLNISTLSLFYKGKIDIKSTLNQHEIDIKGKSQHCF